MIHCGYLYNHTLVYDYLNNNLQVICGVISINQKISIGDPVVGLSMFLVSYAI